MITLPSQELPIPPPTPSVWYLITRLGVGRLVDVQRIDLDALKRRIEARRVLRSGGHTDEGA